MDQQHAQPLPQVAHHHAVLIACGLGEFATQVTDHLAGVRVPAPKGAHGKGDELQPLRLATHELPGHSLVYHVDPIHGAPLHGGCPESIGGREVQTGVTPSGPAADEDDRGPVV